MKTGTNYRKSAKWALAMLAISGATLCAVGEEEKCPVSANVRGHENQADQVAASVSIAPARPVPSPTLAARLAEGPEIYGIVHWGLNTYTDKEWG